MLADERRAAHDLPEPNPTERGDVDHATNSSSNVGEHSSVAGVKEERFVGEVLDLGGKRVRHLDTSAPAAPPGVPRLRPGLDVFVHPVHHPTVGAQDDGIRRIDLLDQPDVLDHLADRGLFRFVEPVRGVHLRDGRHRHLLDFERRAQVDQAIDVPGVEALVTRPEVVLLPHSNSLPVGTEHRLVSHRRSSSSETESLPAPSASGESGSCSIRHFVDDLDIDCVARRPNVRASQERWRRRTEEGPTARKPVTCVTAWTVKYAPIAEA